MGEHIMGFACGIAVYHLIIYLKQLNNDKFKKGEEEPCNTCVFKKAIMESLEDVQAD
jgi:PP-loop superfamily ATP-utilizing enzyme